MKDKKIEQKIYEEFNNKKPELFQSILEQCPKMTEETETSSVWDKLRNVFATRRFAYSFTALILVVAMVLTFMNFGNGTNSQVYSVIAIDVNPSLVLELDEDDRVINVIKNNEDAEIIVGTMDLINVDSEVAINALIGSMVANGYITNITNSLLLSVNSNDDLHEEELIEFLTQKINDLLSGSSISASIITQNLDIEKDVEDLAEELGISEAKAELILSITEIDPRMLAEDLALLSINDLNLLLENKNYVLNNIQHIGNASNLGIVEESEAFQTALDELELDVDDVVEFEIEIEQEDGVIVYEVEIDTDTMEYTVIIDAKLGTVIEVESEDDEEPIIEDALSETQILQLIITELDLLESNISEFELELEEENGVVFYDVSFDYLSDEYDIEIDAVTGFLYSNSMNDDGYEHDDDDD